MKIKFHFFSCYIFNSESQKIYNINARSIVIMQCFVASLLNVCSANRQFCSTLYNYIRVLVAEYIQKNLESVLDAYLQGEPPE